MKKTEIESKTPIDIKPHITEVLNDHPTIQWIVEQRMNILIVIIAIIVATILITRLSTGAPGQKEADLIQTEAEVVNLQKVILGIDNATSVDAAFDKVKQLLKQYPELNTKYDAPLAQAFLAVNNASDATPFADQSLKRTQANNLPTYQEFAKTSLIIGQEKYQEALDKALKIKQELPSESPLFAYNLLRIATLYQALGNKNEELNAWKEWNDQKNSTAFLQVSNQLENGKIRLSDYITQRERELKK